MRNKPVCSFYVISFFIASLLSICLPLSASGQIKLPAKSNSLAQHPYMGWSSWSFLRSKVSEETVKAQVDAKFKGHGFKLFTDEGAWFTDCYYDYANTKTAPGHATIGTGAYTDGHGIESNEFWDAFRSNERKVT